MIVPILSLIFVIAFVAFVVAKGNRETNMLQMAELKEQEAKLNSVIPGTILKKESKSGNPFDEELSSIKVLEIKRNSYGEIWIKFAYENIVTPGKYFEGFPSYDSLENKLKLYPVIVLPKHQ